MSERELVQFNVTAHPTERWTTQQLIEAVPFDTAPRYLIRDRFAFRKKYEIAKKVKKKRITNRYISEMRYHQIEMSRILH